MWLPRLVGRFARFSIGLETPLERRNMLNATIEGSLVVAGVQIAVTFVGVYLLELGGSAAQLGLVNSLPFLFNALSLIIVSRNNGTPAQVLSSAVRAGVAHRFFLLLLPLAPLWGAGAPWWVIAIYSLASGSLMLSSAFWTATVSDMFPAHIRGRVFGIRQMFTGLSAFLATMLVGRLLDAVPFPANFACTFSLAVAVAGAGTLFLRKLVPVGEAGKTEPEPPRLREFLPSPTGRALLGVAVPVGVFNIGFLMLNPVINLYFVQDLGLSKTQIGLLTATFVMAQTVGSFVWGALSDRYGNQAVTIASAAGLAVQAAAYWLSPSFLYLVLAQAVGGFCFAGFLLGTFNALIGIGDKRQRNLVVAGFHFVGNLAGFAAPFLGTWLYSGPGLVPAFLTAAILRGASVLLFVKGSPSKGRSVEGGAAVAAVRRRRRRRTGSAGRPAGTLLSFRRDPWYNGNEKRSDTAV